MTYFWQRRCGKTKWYWSSVWSAITSQCSHGVFMAGGGVHHKVGDKHPQGPRGAKRSQTWLKYSSSRQSSHGSATSSGRSSLEISQHFTRTIFSCKRANRQQTRVEPKLKLRVNACSQHLNWTELNELTQLHDALGIGHVRQGDEVDWLQFANRPTAVQSSSVYLLWTRLLSKYSAAHSYWCMPKKGRRINSLTLLCWATVRLL